MYSTKFGNDKQQRVPAQRQLADNLSMFDQMASNKFEQDQQNLYKNKPNQGKTRITSIRQVRVAPTGLKLQRQGITLESADVSIGQVHVSATN